MKGDYMAVTIKDVAKKANVSTATVSLSLKDDPRIAKTTKEKVVKIAKQMNYLPSNLGRALQSSKSHLIGYILSDVSSSFFNEIVQGIGEIATDRGYGLLVGITDGLQEHEARLLRLFNGKSIDGLIVSHWHPKSVKSLLEMNKGKTPIVVCSNISFDKTIPAVVTDNHLGGKLAIEHLVGLGHKRITYCFSDETQSRYNGCVEAAKQKKIESPRLCATEKELISLLKSNKRPTAVVAFSDIDAIRVKHVAERTGLSIPQDLSITGFDNIWLASLQEFSLTTIKQSQREIGRLAMELLLKRMNGENVKSRLVTPELIIRKSTTTLK